MIDLQIDRDRRYRYPPGPVDILSSGLLESLKSLVGLVIQQEIQLSLTFLNEMLTIIYARSSSNVFHELTHLIFSIDL